MKEVPIQTEAQKAPEPKKSIITQAAEKINSLLSEIKGKMGEKAVKKVEVPQEDKDDGFDPNNLPEYIQAIDRGENPQ